MAVATLHGAHLQSRSQEHPDHDGQGGVAAGLLAIVGTLSTVLEDKVAMRAIAVERRAAVSVAALASASATAAGNFLRDVHIPAGNTVALFCSLPGEIDTGPLVEALAIRRVQLALSRMQGRDRPLAFHRWQPGDLLEVGPFKVLQPPPDTAEGFPDIVVTPLLAFDRFGYRLGWGGGFYDRTIERLRARTAGLVCVGYALDCQEVGRVPREPFDQRLDKVVTERTTHACRMVEP